MVFSSSEVQSGTLFVWKGASPRYDMMHPLLMVMVMRLCLLLRKIAQIEKSFWRLYTSTNTNEISTV